MMTHPENFAVEAPAAAWAGTYSLPNSPQSPALARMLLRQALAECPPPLIESAELLVSEIVTNAVRHAETGLVLEMTPTRTGFRVVVEDTSADNVVPVQPGPADADAGRGLRVVDALAGSWGWERTPTGKRVWFEV
jgi:anti-sigma regulatory factor (Ser/Thr protein kinase)